MTVLNKSTRNVLLDKDHFNRIIFSQLRLFLSPSLLHHCFLQLPLSFNRHKPIGFRLSYTNCFKGLPQHLLRDSICFSQLLFLFHLACSFLTSHCSYECISFTDLLFSPHQNSHDLLLVSNKTYHALHHGKIFPYFISVIITAFYPTEICCWAGYSLCFGIFLTGRTALNTSFSSHCI